MKLSNNEIGTIESVLNNKAIAIQTELSSISKKRGMSIDKFSTYEVEESADVASLLSELNEIKAILIKLSEV